MVLEEILAIIDFSSIAVKPAGTKTHTLLRVHNPEGYSDNFNNSFMSTYFYYFRRDHLGNTREVWRAPFIVYEYGNRTDPGVVVQRTQYYPSGLYGVKAWFPIGNRTSITARSLWK